MGDLVIPLVLLASLVRQAPARAILVEPNSSVSTLTVALQQARPGDTILVLPGTYREPRVTVAVPVTILGQGGPIFDGQGSHEILTV
ncbi:MAG TPA: hypothetical protein VH764_11875, partial [Gemmatimonadales bacterium]